ncbi:hypothetical protein C6990_09800 [Nitrosopumilus sp. b3]|uniref:hypothetical protein n=1 Tax=Nitrosopumilus sp. b3 TaxID=2109909 RepID=UPI0015F72221|nr:hypothetical protein [Nitrosopumilus sp. b3]KAF6246404.1 hypothetical protein C6990_09800 [Nitrosopumilus sp. b3]
MFDLWVILCLDDCYLLPKTFIFTSIQNYLLEEVWDRDSVQYQMIAQDLEKFGVIQGESHLTSNF